MKLKTIVGVLVVAGCSALIANRVVSQDPGDAAKPGMPSAEEMKAMQEGMAKWLAAMNPGKHHEPLKYFVGSWKTKSKVWYGGPGSEAMETEGRSTVKWVLGKRFILHEHTGEMFLPDPANPANMKKAPYQGRGLTGYDNGRNMYTSSWASNMGTDVLTMKGSVDPSGKLFRFYGEMDEPMLGVVGRTVKYVTRIINDDKYVFEIIDLHASDDYKVTEITYTRVK